MRIRKIVSGTAEKPRMSVFRSNKQISVQLIDDLRGVTLAAASSLDKEVDEKALIKQIADAKAEVEELKLFPASTSDGSAYKAPGTF